jgi:hypothetical protein
MTTITDPRTRLTSILGDATGAVNSRRLVNHIAGAAVPDPANPALATDGWSLLGRDLLHLYLVPAGAAPNFTVQIWIYSWVDAQWHATTAIAGITENHIHQETVNGEDRVYLQVTAKFAAADSLEIWGAANDPA